MLYEHFYIDTDNTPDNKQFQAEIYCRYCKQNVYFSKKWFGSKKEALDDLIELYNDREERGMGLHLMMCKKYRETLLPKK